MDMRVWLAGLGLEQYTAAFEREHIDVAVLPTLSDADLRELGVQAMGDRKRLMQAARVVAQDSGVASVAPANAERRPVTIMFADLSGFTALSSTVDAEELRRIVGRYTAMVDTVVEELGGCVDKHIGDAVMALFGAPVAHGDDAVRAARAALEVHRGMERLSRDLGRELTAHVGMATGEVVAGTISRGAARDYTVLGDAVNLASRLDGLAAGGETCISDAVYQALEGQGVAQDLGLRAVKGLEAPVRVWRLTGLKPRPGAATPLVGRREEVAVFTQLVALAQASSTGQALVLVAEPGLGKTRLLEECCVVAQSQGLAVHRAVNTSFGTLRGEDVTSVLALGLLGCHPSDGLVERERAVGRLDIRRFTTEWRVVLRSIMDLPLTGAESAWVAGLAAPQWQALRADVLREVLVGAAQRQPRLLALEDLHWASPRALEDLATLAQAATNLGVVVLCTMRPEALACEDALRPLPVTRRQLRPLSVEEARSLARLLGPADDAFALACAERAAGHPLFLEQLLKSQARAGVLPASLHNVILARVDALSVDQRRWLQTAAILGALVDPAAVASVTGLPAGVARELLEQGLLKMEDNHLRFAHALLQDGTAATVLRDHRVAVHAAAARWFEQRDPVLHAHHLQHAGSPAAPAAWMGAARLQRSIGRMEDARQSLEYAVSGASGQAQAEAQVELGNVLHHLAQVAAALNAFKAAQAQTQKPAVRAEAVLGEVACLESMERPQEALALLDSAADAILAVPRQDLHARLHCQRGDLLFSSGRAGLMEAEQQRGLVAARIAGVKELEVRALCGLGDATYAQARMLTALGHFQQAVALCQSVPLPHLLPVPLFMLGFIRWYANQLPKGVEELQQAVEAATTVHDPRVEAMARLDLGVLLAAMGRAQEATTTLEHARGQMRQLGLARFELMGHQALVRLGIQQGRRAALTRDMEQILEQCGAAAMDFLGGLVLGLLAWAHPDGTVRARARADGIKLLRTNHLAHNALTFHADCVEGALERHNWAEALEHATALEQVSPEDLPFVGLLVRRCRTLVDHARAPTPSTLAALREVRQAVTDAHLAPLEPLLDAALAVPQL